MADPTKSAETLKQDDVNVPGEAIRLGRLFYVLPPAPLVHMPKLKAVLSGGDFSADEGYSNALVDAVYYSLRRNYPTVGREQVAENIDMTNFRGVMDAFMKANGLQQATPSDKPLGEATGS